MITFTFVIETLRRSIMKNLLFLPFLMCFFFGCQDDFEYPKSIKPEFNICDQWKEGMSWDDFQAIRTRLERKDLVPYVDKIQVNKMLKAQGIPVMPVIYASNTKDDFLTHLAGLKTFVAKPSHMSQNNGLIIYDNGINKIVGAAITLSEVQQRMHQAIDTPTNSDEWILRNIPRGFLIQEFIAGRQEIKIQTIWGKPLEVVFVQGGERMMHYYYSPEGESLRSAPPFPFSLELLDRAKEIAKSVAKDTDALRVDIMVRTNSDGSNDLMVNELELRSAIRFVNINKFADLLNKGYRHLCKSHQRTE
jgi:hypothetical protein